jgi:hypothetical protein
MSNETWMPPVSRAAIDVLHREDMNARRPDLLFLTLIEVANADEHCVLRQDGWREADRGEFDRFLSEQCSQWHPVDVAALGRARRVHVAMRIHPDEAQRFGHAPAEPLSTGGH